MSNKLAASKYDKFCGTIRAVQIGGQIVCRPSESCWIAFAQATHNRYTVKINKQISWHRERCAKSHVSRGANFKCSHSYSFHFIQGGENDSAFAHGEKNTCLIRLTSVDGRLKMVDKVASTGRWSLKIGMIA